jgi:hypothetical protein
VCTYGEVDVQLELHDHHATLPQHRGLQGLNRNLICTVWCDNWSTPVSVSDIPAETGLMRYKTSEMRSVIQSHPKPASLGVARSPLAKSNCAFRWRPTVLAVSLICFLGSYSVLHWWVIGKKYRGAYETCKKGLLAQSTSIYVSLS